MAKPRPPSPTLPLSRQVEALRAPPTSRAVSAEHAGLAGTLLSETSHTPSTDRSCNMTKEQLKLFYEILDTKNSWGKNEIRTLLLEIVSGIRTSI